MQSTHRARRTSKARALRPLSVAIAAVASLALVQAECSGGASSRTGSGAGTGSTAIFITDAPSDDFDKILVTIASLVLIGDGEQVTIFTGRETIDLKDLENFSDLFVYAEKVPVGFYHKIRMGVTRIRLVREGSSPEVIDVDPPAGGKIDLLSKEQFLVREGITLVIELDMDAQKSIHYVETGNGKYRFRPVVFVDIDETRSPRKLARVHGEIVEILDEDTFELCSTEFMASRDVPESTDGRKDGGLGERHRCMTVEIDADTGIFDSNGDPGDIGDLSKGSEVTLVGRFHLVDANHDDPIAMPLNADGFSASDDPHPERPDIDIVFLAYVVEIGPTGTFLTLRGTIESETNGDEFDFGVAPNQGFGDQSIVTALLQEGTRIFSKRGVELDDSAIGPDIRALIDGVFSANTAETLYKTALLILKLQPEVEDVLRGEIADLDEDRRRMLLAVEDDGAVVEECVAVPEEARIILVTEGADATARERGSFEDLRVGWRSDVYGMFAEAVGCFVAETVVAFPEPIECSTNGDCADADFCSQESCDGIGLCELRPEVCTLDDAVVCGCDGVTYANECQANHFGSSVASPGACDGAGNACTADGFPACAAGELCLIGTGSCDSSAMGLCVKEPDECPEDDKPVCGCDERTYRNACVAAKAEVVVESTGACSQDVCGGDEQLACAEGDVCRISSGMCEMSAEGACVERPANCPTGGDPVCGCDGITYRNACLALEKGVTVEFDGFCESGIVCGGTNPPCLSGQLCVVEAGVCDEYAEGRCVSEPPECPGVEPVCGCDDKTYRNACAAAVAGVTVASEHACDFCGGEEEIECSYQEVCLVAAGLCDEPAEGLCVDRPEVCTTEVVPVCGCDGETYSNACKAMMAGVAIDSEGTCPSVD